MRIKNALVYTVEHGFVERDVRIKNGCFAGSEAAGTDGEEILDAGGDYLIPGLVDIHFHGCAGHDFSDGTPEALQAIGAVGDVGEKCGISRAKVNDARAYKNGIFFVVAGEFIPQRLRAKNQRDILFAFTISMAN